MKNSRKILWLCLICVGVLFLTTGEAYADDVLQAVRAQAVKVLSGLRPVIFILAGFGLIGFAWMAIFNKISWKWFANIAMGLFLVANMGLFIDYFATKSGEKGTYSKELGFGNYITQKEYAGMSGTSSDPKSQSAKSEGDPTAEGGNKENSESSGIDGAQNCTPGVGTNCSGTPGDGAGKGGSSTESGNATGTGNTPSGAQLNDLAQKAKEQYNQTGQVDMNKLINDEVAAGRMTPEQAASAGSYFTDVANAKGGDVGKAIDNAIDNSMQQAKEEYEREQEQARQDFFNQNKGQDPTTYDGGTIGEVEVTGKAPSKTGAGLDHVLNDTAINNTGKLENPLNKNNGNNYDIDGGMLDEVVITPSASMDDVENYVNQGSNSNTGSNMPSAAQMNELAKRAQEQYNKTGKVDMNKLLREEIAAGRMTAEQAARAGGIFTDVANSKGGDVGKAIDDVLDGSMAQAKEEYEREQEQARQDFFNQNKGDNTTYDGGTLDEVEVTGKAPSKTGAGLDHILNDTAINNTGKLENPLNKNNGSKEEESGGLSYFACQKQGGTWDNASGTCKGAKPADSSSADDEEEESKKDVGFEDDDNSGISFYACQQKGGTWSDNGCVLPGDSKKTDASSSDSAASEEAECKSRGSGYIWYGKYGCMRKSDYNNLTEEKERACRAKGGFYTPGKGCMNGDTYEYEPD